MILIGAETAFDVLVSCVNAHLAGHTFEDFITRWVAAYNAGRVHDVCIRRKLLDLAASSYRWQRFSDGRAIRIGYDLATTAKRLAGISLSKPTKETAATHRAPALRRGRWRAPVEQWPPGFREYAEEDATATLASFLAQEKWRGASRANGSPSSGRSMLRSGPSSPPTAAPMSCPILPRCAAPDATRPLAESHVRRGPAHRCARGADLQASRRDGGTLRSAKSFALRISPPTLRCWRSAAASTSATLKRMRAEGNVYKGNAAWRELQGGAR